MTGHLNGLDFYAFLTQRKRSRTALLNKLHQYWAGLPKKLHSCSKKQNSFQNTSVGKEEGETEQNKSPKKQHQPQQQQKPPTWPTWKESI